VSRVRACFASPVPSSNPCRCPCARPALAPVPVVEPVEAALVVVLVVEAGEGAGSLVQNISSPFLENTLNTYSEGRRGIEKERETKGREIRIGNGVQIRKG
jgi:hypothetical protein